MRSVQTRQNGSDRPSAAEEDGTDLQVEELSISNSGPVPVTLITGYLGAGAQQTVAITCFVRAQPQTSIRLWY